MSIYVRGDEIPCEIIGKSVGSFPTITILWANEPDKPHRTDMSRLIADGGTAEIEQALSLIPCPWCKSTGAPFCCVDEAAMTAKANGRAVFA